MVLNFLQVAKEEALGLSYSACSDLWQKGKRVGDG